MRFLHQDAAAAGCSQAGDRRGLPVTWASVLWGVPVLLVVPCSALAEPSAQPPPKSSTCPYGFYRSGDRCLSTPGSTRRAVEKVANSCPLGWFSSGNYCVKSR
jgi:hypothetical protein